MKAKTKDKLINLALLSGIGICAAALYLLLQNGYNTGKQIERSMQELVETNGKLQDMLLKYAAPQEVEEMFVNSDNGDEQIQASLDAVIDKMFLPYNIIRYYQIQEAFKTSLKSGTKVGS